MSDEVLNIKVTEPELDFITLLLEQAGNMEDSNGQPAFELLHDLMEQAARPGEWSDPGDLVICDAEIKTGVNHDKHIAETQMFNAGVDAREKMKATSRAAGRRALNFDGSRDESDRTETQQVDVWAPPPNDPAKW